MTANSEDPHQLDRQFELFDKLIAVSDENERLAILESIGQEDPELKTELEGLLKSHAAPMSNLLDETDSLLAGSGLAGALKQGDGVGNYKVLQLIGEGGMGQVYMAEQQTGIRRRVALKLMLSHRISSNLVARFDGEREALSRLDHPGIARILDAGETELGQHYFVMELIKGKSIFEFCDREKLDLRQRLELFIDVCRAIHHAHQKGIIHRDIKPSNILVALKDGEPTVKVIDFGIAKGLEEPLSEKTMFTKFGELIGTPNYMSPEQVENGGVDLDVRSDIYSLGVLLHELVTGRLPFEFRPDRGLLKQLEELRDSDTVRPSLLLTQSMDLEADTVEELAANRRVTSGGLLRFVQGDLDWILLKVLSKTRSERYDSAAALADDVRRFLNQEAVEAVAPHWTYKPRKFFQKHRAACMAAAAAMLSLIGLSIFSTYSAIASYSANEKLKRQTEKLQSEIERSRELESRASVAERQANELARQRQNEAAIERAKSRYFMQAVQESKLSAATIMAMSEWQREGQSLSLGSRAVVVTEKPVLMELAASDHRSELLEKIRKSLLQSDGNTKKAEYGADDRLLSEADRLSGLLEGPSVLPPQRVPIEQLNRERLRLRECLKAEQILEFGNEDEFVGQNLREIAKLHIDLSDPLQAQLALHQAINILQDPEQRAEARELLSELQSPTPEKATEDAADEK